MGACMSVADTHATLATARKTQSVSANAGSSRAHWFLVCLWYAVVRYTRAGSTQRYLCAGIGGNKNGHGQGRNGAGSVECVSV
jgi:hypothetical protein